MVPLFADHTGLILGGLGEYVIDAVARARSARTCEEYAPDASRFSATCRGRDFDRLCVGESVVTCRSGLLPEVQDCAAIGAVCGSENGSTHCVFPRRPEVCGGSNARQACQDDHIVSCSETAYTAPCPMGTRCATVALDAGATPVEPVMTCQRVDGHELDRCFPVRCPDGSTQCAARGFDSRERSVCADTSPRQCEDDDELHCEGPVLRGCIHGRPQQIDCAAMGRSCRDGRCRSPE